MTEKIQYPTPEARAHIVTRRNQLHRDLVEYIVTRSPKEGEARAQLNPIVREYGFDEVYRMLQKISPRLNVVLIALFGIVPLFLVVAPRVCARQTRRRREPG